MQTKRACVYNCSPIKTDPNQMFAPCNALDRSWSLYNLVPQESHQMFAQGNSLIKTTKMIMFAQGNVV